MKRIQWLLLFTFSLVFCMEAFAINEMAATPTMATKTKLIVKGKLPTGVVIKKGKVTVKEGYTLTKVSDNQAQVSARMNNGGGTTGNFECACSTGGGGCKVVIEGNSVTCVEGGGCTKGVCSMTITIPSATKVMQ